jgi:hypothetical protein
VWYAVCRTLEDCADTHDCCSDENCLLSTEIVAKYECCDGSEEAPCSIRQIRAFRDQEPERLGEGCEGEGSWDYRLRLTYVVNGLSLKEPKLALCPMDSLILHR